jgi:hypothetical protein
VKKHTVKYSFAIVLLFLILGISFITISLSQKTADLNKQKNTSVSQQLESVDRDYETNGEQEEMPHFNLFSIINKFIPN